MFMDKLSTEALLGIKSRIENILKEREEAEDWTPYSETMSREEYKRLKKNQWEECYERFIKDFNKFVTLKRKHLLEEYAYVENFSYLDWDRFIKYLNKIGFFKL